MKKQIEILVNLQKVDTEIFDTKLILSNISGEIDGLDSKFKEYEENYNEKQAVIEELGKKYRSCESETELNLSNINKSREKLKNIKTNKEYQLLLKSIESIEKINSKIEDEMLQYLDDIDQAKNELKDAKIKLEEMSLRIKDEKKAVKQKSEKYHIKIIDLNVKRKELMDTVEPKMLEIFLATQKQMHGGVAIASVKNSICKICNVNMPPQLFNELQRCDSLKFCPNCQRMIYWDKDSQE